MSADNQSVDQQMHGAYSRCGERARIMLKCHDPDKNKEVRMYRCQCGEVMCTTRRSTSWKHRSASERLTSAFSQRSSRRLQSTRRPSGARRWVTTREEPLKT